MTQSHDTKDVVIKEVVSDLNSMRSLFNWILLVLLVWVCIYSTIYHPEAIPTIIVTLGTLCGTMFVAYVGSKTYERTNSIEDIRIVTPPITKQGLSSDEQ